MRWRGLCGALAFAEDDGDDGGEDEEDAGDEVDGQGLVEDGHADHDGGQRLKGAHNGGRGGADDADGDAHRNQREDGRDDGEHQ